MNTIRKYKLEGKLHGFDVNRIGKYGETIGGTGKSSQFWSERNEIVGKQNGESSILTSLHMAIHGNLEMNVGKLTLTVQ